jgi:hypothetical protein
MRENLGNGSVEEAGLTLHELGELIRRAGREAGFAVRSEYPVGKGKRNAWRIDWVWLWGETVVMAFEIEGRNVPESSLAGDRRKFRELSSSCAKVVALYTVRGETSLALPRKRRTPIEWMQEEWEPRHQLDTVQVTLDAELFAPGGIEQLQELAKKRAGL